MQNPWINFKKLQPYVLDIDKSWFDSYTDQIQKLASRKNESSSKELLLHDYLFHTDDIPFPYYGNSNTAKVVVLQANPGHDEMFYQRPDTAEILELDCKNLLHANDPGIYSMAVKYREWTYSNGIINGDWYWKRTRHLREQVGWENVARGIIYLEMFPYRSKKLHYPENLPPSQQYTFYLLRKMLEKHVFVIISRMESWWKENVPVLADYEYICRLRSRQNAALSPGNMKIEEYNSIVQLLK